jgi:hypothetical protein
MGVNAMAETTRPIVIDTDFHSTDSPVLSTE